MNAHASTSSGHRAVVSASGGGHDISRTTSIIRNPRGFTIVELLTVVGIIAIIMAITVPALRGVQTRTRKTLEANNIRQIHTAWQTYGNFNRDAAAPGYLEPEVQKAWRVRYQYPLPPDAANPDVRDIRPETAAPWTWRLGPYYDHNLEVTWRYRNGVSLNWPATVALARDGALADQGIDNVAELMDVFAHEPGFGYNAYHVGGWWDMQQLDGAESGGEFAMPKFFDATEYGGSKSVEVVSRSIASIRRPADLILFCTSTMYGSPNVHHIRDDNYSGSHLTMPPFLADEARWESPPPGGTAHTERIETYVPDTHAPLGRYNDRPTLINADGSIESPTMIMLFDMRRWIDNPLGMDVNSNAPYQPWFQ